MIGIVTLMLLLQDPQQGLVRLEDLPLKYSTPLSAVTALEVVPERSTYESREPVTLRFIVRNVSNGDVLCHCIPRAEARISYRHENGPIRTLQLRRGRQHIIPLYKLRPTEENVDSEVVAYDLAKGAPPFDVPGAYQLSAVYFDSEGKAGSRLESRVVSIRIGAPTDSEAHDAYSDDLAQLAHLGSRSASLGDATIEEAAAFLRRFGGSVYAPVLRRGLRANLERRVHMSIATERQRELYEALVQEEAAKARPRE